MTFYEAIINYTVDQMAEFLAAILASSIGSEVDTELPPFEELVADIKNRLLSALPETDEESNTKEKE